MPSPTTYSRTQIALHWAIALLVIFQIAFHEDIANVWSQRMRGTIPNEFTPHPHAFIGTIIFALVLWRLWLRFTRGTPALPEKEHPALRFIASATHVLFYLLLVLMPISGALAWFGGFPTPADAHSLLEKILIPLILLHFVAALAQHFWFKTNVLKRILGMA